jgi:thiamine pyrophosphate-dependent acetolactate synthase large subunit-like protein
MTNGWSTMGFGIPAAIAAKLMHPERKVCAVVGDGGFLMTAGEIATAIRCKLNIVILLLTDNDLALIRIKQEKKGNPIYGRRYGSAARSAAIIFSERPFAASKMRAPASGAGMGFRGRRPDDHRSRCRQPRI